MTMYSKNKKIILIMIFLFSIIFPFSVLAAQEKKMSVGLGLEWNMNSRHNFAGGTSLYFDYYLPSYATVGVTVSGNNNFSGITVIEPTFLFRAYILQNDYSGPFIQYDMGPFFILEDGKRTTMIEIGARAGYRFLPDSNFYVEPYGRLGVPFAFGIGVMAGICF